MPNGLAVANSSSLMQEIEPILVSLYKSDNGKSPTIYELKQYLVSYASEKLVDILINSESTIFSSMTPKETLTTVNLYIRKLRVW
ncbi:MAG: hypothetical protein AB8B92_11205 [Gammaproteobacteria bacterium]